MSEHRVTSYGEFEKNFKKELEFLYKKKEIYSNKEESKDEVKLWDEISGCVSKWNDGDPIDNEKYSQIKGCFDSYKNKISEDKKIIFNNILLQLNNVALRYGKHRERMSNYQKIVEDARSLGNDYNKFMTFALFEEKNKRDPEKNFVYKGKKEKFDKSFDPVIKGLKGAYFDFSGEDIRSLNNISNSFRIYSAHRKKGSENIDKLCDYLLAGIDVIFCSECFYTKFGNYPPLKITILKNDSVDSIQKVYKDSLNVLKNKCIRENLGEYSVSCIIAFIENLKKGKF